MTSSPASPETSAVVIGAGVAGLLVARDLARAGVPVTVVEASERVGGQLASLRIAGIQVDAAAESFATRGGAVEALAVELGLGDDVVRPAASPAWLVDGRGRAHPLPAAGVLGIPADPRAADVVAAVGRLGAWRAAFDRVAPLRHPDSYRSVGDVVRRRMGTRVLRRLVAPVVRGVYSADPDAVPLERVSPTLRAELGRTGSLASAVQSLGAASPAGSQVAGIRGGVHRLASALADDARASGARILLGTRVVSVEHRGVHLEGGGFVTGRVVRAATQPDAALRTRRVVVAVAAVDAPGLDSAPRGTGALVQDGADGITARALTHSSAKWRWLHDELPAHRHMVRLSYDEMPDDPEATVSADLRAITGVQIDRLLELELRSWTRTLEAAPAPDGSEHVGEAASVTGLASIVPAARTTAARISAELGAARAGGPEG